MDARPQAHGPARAAPDYATDERGHQTLLGVRQVIASYTMYWHKLIVDAMVFVITGSIALAGYALTREQSDVPTAVSLAALQVVFGLCGALLCRVLSRETLEHRRILAKIDHADALFEKDRYIAGDSVYPAAWATSGSEGSPDPIARYCIGAQLVVPVILALLTVGKELV